MKLLSVIIPCYNKAKYINQCISSILAQTYKDLEIIVVDDCSTDDSYFLAKECAEANHNVRVYQNKTNSGVSATRNNGASYANTPYITFLDADDYYFDVKKIEREIGVIIAYGSMTVAYSNIVFVDAQGTQISIMKFPSKISGRKLKYKNVIGLKQIHCRDYILSIDIFQKVGGYDVDSCLFEDLDLLFRLSYLCDFVNTNNNGTAYRQLDDGLSSRSLQIVRKTQDEIVKRYLKKPDFFNPSAYWCLRVFIRKIKDIFKKSWFYKMIS